MKISSNGTSAVRMLSIMLDNIETIQNICQITLQYETSWLLSHKLVGAGQQLYKKLLPEERSIKLKINPCTNLGVFIKVYPTSLLSTLNDTLHCNTVEGWTQ